MKAATRINLSLADIAPGATVFALAILVSASAAALGSDLFLLALAFAGVIVSGINGFGRRMAMAQARVTRGSKVTQRRIAFPS